jgi:hypothetical protein
MLRAVRLNEHSEKSPQAGDFHVRFARIASLALDGTAPTITRDSSLGTHGWKRVAILVGKLQSSAVIALSKKCADFIVIPVTSLRKAVFHRFFVDFACQARRNP